MADNKEEQLEKLEADRKKHVDAISQLDKQITEIRSVLRDAVLAELKKKSTAYEFTPEEIFGAAAVTKAKNKPKSNAKRGPAVVKYRDENGNTWGGGKGPRPAWVKAIQEANGDLEKYLVKAI
jgi:DNA-binding protein H-NS